MKRKAESAWVEDVDSDTEEVLEDTRLSASIFVSAESFQARRKSRRTSDKDSVQSSQNSSSLGPMLDLIREHAGKSDGDKSTELLTILACRYDDNDTVWKDCKSAMRNCRVFYFADEIINRETATYVEREIVVSKGQDISHPNPSIIIAQRTYDAANTIQLHAHRLSFDGLIDPDRTYIFPRLGDEIPGVGGARPALHCRFRAIEQFGQYSRFGHFGGFDRDISIKVTADDVQADRRITYDFAQDALIVPRDDELLRKPAFGMSVQAGDLASLLPPKGSGSQPGKSLCFTIIGAGPKIDGHPFNADINVRFHVG